MFYTSTRDKSVKVTAAEAIALAKKEDGVVMAMDGKTVVKEIYVPGKLVNIVVK